MSRLATRRLIFHSEADFQRALAWQVQLDDPSARVGLESRPGRGVHLDLLVELAGDTCCPRTEISRCSFNGAADGERFDLPNQGAYDIARHDVVKDVVRVE